MTSKRLDRDGHDPLGFYTAAVRELFEESGVLLLCDEAGRIVSGESYREISRSITGETSHSSTRWSRVTCSFAGHRLEFLQLFTTPAFAPMRFYTVFFLTEMPEGQEAGDGIRPEVEQWLWVDAGQRHSNETDRADFPLIPPTMAALHMVMSK